MRLPVEARVYQAHGFLGEPPYITAVIHTPQINSQAPDAA